jgi:hypothetical protein
MGTSVKMIDETYGHLAPNADAYERDLLDGFASANGCAAAARFCRGGPGTGMEPRGRTAIEP